MTIDQVLAEVDRLECKMVEVTGGEPLLQRDTFPLVGALADRGYTVLVETGGHRDISLLDPRAIRVMDLKCPASGECQQNLWSNLKHLRSCDEVKFVIANEEDYRWALQTIRQHRIEGKAGLLISTAYGLIEPRQVVEWMLEDKLQARFQLQLHKYIWEPTERGR